MPQRGQGLNGPVPLFPNFGTVVYAMTYRPLHALCRCMLGLTGADFDSYGIVTNREGACCACVYIAQIPAAACCMASTLGAPADVSRTSSLVARLRSFLVELLQMPPQQGSIAIRDNVTYSVRGLATRTCLVGNTTYAESWSAGDLSEVLVFHQQSQVSIMRKDMACLAPAVPGSRHTQLNDEVVNIYMGLLQERDTRTRGEVCIFGCQDSCTVSCTRHF